MLIVVVVLQYVTSYNCDFEWIHYYDCLCIFIYIPCAQQVCQENLKRFLSNMKHERVRIKRCPRRCTPRQSERKLLK